MRNIGVLCLAATLGCQRCGCRAGQDGVRPAQGGDGGLPERYEPGSGGGTGPVFYDGFSVETGFEYRALVSDEPPCSDANQCLKTFVSPLYSPMVGTPMPPPTATFTNFRAGTTSFGIRLPGTFGPYSGRVVGASGTLGFLGFVLGQDTFGPLTMAFHDPGGITSFSITGPAEYDERHHRHPAAAGGGAAAAGAGRARAGGAGRAAGVAGYGAQTSSASAGSSPMMSVRQACSVAASGSAA